LWPTHTKFSNTTAHVRVREYGVTCTVPLYKSKLLHQKGYGARARDSVNFRKFSSCIVRVRRACAGWTVYPPMSFIPPNKVPHTKVQYSPSIGEPKLRNLLSHNGKVRGMVDSSCSCFFLQKCCRVIDASISYGILTLPPILIGR
jgi:hypothetical protein